MSFSVKFWGVRGSIACPGETYLQYGGNTSCVELKLGGERVIFDCGTGLRNLGRWFLKRRQMRATILMSHTHWDHISGFPFFAPAFRDDHAFRLMAGHLGGRSTLREVFSSQMTDPFFPVPLDIMRAHLDYEDFSAGDRFFLTPQIEVRTTPLNHPDGATGYRVTYQGKSVCYVTDTEHLPGRPDQNILGLIEGADLLIYDSTYTDEEFPERIGWGHSTWQEGVRLAEAAGVKRYAIFHHDPDHEDAIMSAIESEARHVFPGAFAARDNLTVPIA